MYPEMFAELLAAHDKFTVYVGAGVPLPVKDSAVDDG